MNTTLRSTSWLALLAAGCGSSRGGPPAPSDDARHGGDASRVEAAVPSGDAAASTGSDGASPTGDGGALEVATPPPPDATPVFGAPGCGSELVFSGQERIVEAFPTGPGVVVARASAILLVDRTGQILRKLEMPREVTAAAYDGTRLVVADRAMLTELKPTLEPMASRPLRDTCQGVAILPDGRILCGGGAFHVLYRLDGSAPGQLVSAGGSGAFRVIPGRPEVMVGAFLTSFPDGGSELFAGGGGFGSPTLGPLFAFKGSPATHLVASDGSYLKITGPECAPSIGGFGNSCYGVDGKLATLRPMEAYIGMVEDSPASVLALVRKNATSSFPQPSDRLCADGCFAQRIDLGQGTIVSEKMHRLDGVAWKTLHPDPFCKKLMVVSRTVAEAPFEQDPEPVGDYRIQLLDYGAPEGAPVLPAAGFRPLPPSPAPAVAPAAAACAAPGNLLLSDERILDAHPTQAGIIVARPSGLLLVDRQGAVKAQAQRQVVATTFDGTRLLASDPTGVTVYDPALTAQGTVPTTGACGGLMFIDGNRFMCGADTDVDDVFRTYDLTTKGELATSAKNTYRGRHLFRIPGQSSFVTVTPFSSPQCWP
jgi:hypothetical protein